MVVEYISVVLHSLRYSAGYVLIEKGPSSTCAPLQRCKTTITEGGPVGAAPGNGIISSKSGSGGGGGGLAKGDIGKIVVPRERRTPSRERRNTRAQNGKKYRNRRDRRCGAGGGGIGEESVCISSLRKGRGI